MPDRMISPQSFLEAERFIDEILKAKGYIVQKLGYHSYFSEVARETISQFYKPTPLYIRTLPDRLVIGEDGAMLVEIKDASDRSNIAIEAFPFIVSLYLRRKFNILTLYLFFDGNDISGDFVQNLLIDRVIIPQERESYQSPYWFSLLRESFPAIKEIERMETTGSQDPFLIMNEDKRQSLKSLKDLFQ